MVAVTATDIVKTSDGVPLRLKLRRAERSRRLRAAALVLPLFLFILITFVRPIVSMLQNAVDDPEYIGEELSQTLEALRGWDGQSVPDEAVFAALVSDLKKAQKEKKAALIGKRLNYVQAAIRSKVIATARKVEKLEAGPYREAVLEIEPIWGQANVWHSVAAAGQRFTPFYLLAVLDRTSSYSSSAIRNDPGTFVITPWPLALLAALMLALVFAVLQPKRSAAAAPLMVGSLATAFVIAVQQPDALAKYGVAGVGIVAALGGILARFYPIWSRISGYLLGGAIICLIWFIVLLASVKVDPQQAIYIMIIKRTFIISLQVTLATLLLGFPVAYLLASLPARTSNLLMILVLLPFWTSLLVRTTAWFVVLQDNGIINDTLQYLHLSDQPLRLIFSRFGTIVAMTHIQLPFTLLPIYSVMKTIPPSHVRAARSLGAGPFYAFWRVYFPQTLPGIAAGCLLTFILSLGYYITPALVGGPTDQMVSGFIAVAINQENNWGKASALGVILLVATIILYFVYNRLIGVDKMKFG